MQKQNNGNLFVIVTLILTQCVHTNLPLVSPAASNCCMAQATNIILYVISFTPRRRRPCVTTDFIYAILLYVQWPHCAVPGPPPRLRHDPSPTSQTLYFLLSCDAGGGMKMKTSTRTSKLRISATLVHQSATKKILT